MPRRHLAVVMSCVLVFSAFAGSSATGQTADPLLKIKMYSSLEADLRDFTFSQRMSVPLVGGVPTVKIATGTILKFNGGPILLPDGEEPLTWRAENGSGFDQPFSLLNADPDPDLPGFTAPSKLNFGLFDANTGACGDSADNPCLFDGSNPDPVEGVLNAGDQVRKFFVKITAEPGTTLWATHQVYSATLADLRIDIVGSENAATTQAEIDQAAADYKVADSAEARDLIEVLEQPTFEEVDGHRVYDAYAGYDTETTSFFKFFPSKLRIEKGDSVNWHFDVLQGEVHTTTFPFSLGTRISNKGFMFACDPDGDEGPLADRQPNFDNPNPCKNATPEVDLNKKLTAEIGDGTYPGGTKKLETSGLRGAIVPTGNGVAGGTADYDLTFDQRSGDTPFDYICAFHGGFMSARVVVK